MANRRLVARCIHTTAVHAPDCAKATKIAEAKMSDTGKPRIRQGIQLVQHDELNAELNVLSEDEAASLLWAAQWLDEHREYAVTAIRLDNTADPDDEDDVTTTIVITLHRANEHEPGRLGPWPHSVPPSVPRFS